MNRRRKNRLAIAIALLVIAILSFGYFLLLKIPSEIARKGPQDFTKEIFSLAIAIVSLSGSVINLIAARKRLESTQPHQKPFSQINNIPTAETEYMKQKNSSIIKILFLAANPIGTSQLRLDEEVRGIEQALRQSEFRERFEIKQHWAVRVIDLQGYLLRHKPNIVHFSGHGSESSEIILEDNQGNSQPVSSRALSQLFSVVKDNIRCVVLNACYSKLQAKAIAKHIDCVIGMSKAIGDSAAINFATAFYQALGYGRDIKTAFELGCGLIDLQGLNEQDTPKLLSVNSKPDEIFFIESS